MSRRLCESAGVAWRRSAAASVLLAVVGCSPGAAGSAVTPPWLEGLEPEVIAEGAAWTWFNDERALFHDGRLIVGYVDTAGYAGAGVVPLGVEADSAGAPGGASVRRHRLGTFREVDDHNNPSFVALGDGRVLAAYAAHHTQPHWYWRTAELEGEPGADSLVWAPERRTPDLGANITYSNLVRLREEGGRVYNFFRGTNFDPTFRVSADGGRSWGAPRHLIRSGGGGTRPYVKYATDGESRIDLLYTQAHPRDAETDIYHVFYQNGWLHRSDGTRIQRLPDQEGPGGEVPPMTVEAGTRVYDAREAGRAWVWDLEYDGDGAPVAVYVAARDSTVGNDLRYRYARWDREAGAWREAEIGHAGTHLYDGERHYAGGIVLDPRDPRTVYISADVHPGTAEPTPHYRIYRGRSQEDGERGGVGADRWSWEVLAGEPGADDIRPFVPRGGGEHRALLWLRGRYTTYQHYDTDVVGIIRRGSELNPEP